MKGKKFRIAAIIFEAIVGVAFIGLGIFLPLKDGTTDIEVVLHGIVCLLLLLIGITSCIFAMLNSIRLRIESLEDLVYKLARHMTEVEADDIADIKVRLDKLEEDKKDEAKKC